ncbi:MAG: M15 family metallopeptidase [Actinomycetota bacterium]|nr:M15 family metallopeptidase [Actinomycetota bacterium]
MRPVRRAAAAGALVVLLAGGCAGSATEASEDVPTSTTVPATAAGVATTTTIPSASTTTAAPRATTTTVAPTPTVAPPTTIAPAEPAFGFAAARIGEDLAATIVGSSWREGCPVPLDALRYVTLSHWGYDGLVHEGELVVHADVVDDIRHVFAGLFAERFPIREMRLVDAYGADDFTSIEHDNTSAFNCRPITGSTTTWSNHAYGRAIDINPIENPYVRADGTSAHTASAPFLDRADVRPGMIVAGSTAVRLFAERGWAWGGDWTSPVDHQHFEKPAP